VPHHPNVRFNRPGPREVAFSHRDLMERVSHQALLQGPPVCALPAILLRSRELPRRLGFRYALSLLGRGGTMYFLGLEPADILQIIDLHKIQGNGDVSLRPSVNS